MKVGSKTVIRGSAQTWRGVVAGAWHYSAILTNTETGHDIYGPSGCVDEATALKWCATHYLAEFDLSRHILVLGASCADMCLDWR